MPFRPLSRRTLLRGAGVCVALPFLEAMLPRKAAAQDEVKRFIAFFYPNGTDPRLWNPPAGALTAARWLATREHPGLYTLDDLASDHLRGLLTPTGRPTPAGAPA